MKYGLSEAALKEIQQVFTLFKEIETVILFGSRAMGSHKEASDIDLVIKGKNCNTSLTAKVKSYFEEETYLPYFFDVINYESIQSEELIEHINQYGIRIYLKGWVETILGEVIRLKTGKLNSNAAVENGEYPFFTCSPTTYKIDNYAFDTEALLLAGNNANAVYSLKYYKGKFNAYQRTYVITVDDEITNYKFLYYLLNLKLNYLKEVSQGSATKFLTVVILREIRLNLPPLSEQKIIAKILTAFDNKIENLQDQNKTLETTAQTIFKKWFGKYQIGDELPDGWSIGKYNDLVKVSSGKGVKKVDYIDDGEFEIIGANGTIGKLDKYLINEKVILTGRVGTLGTVFILNRPAWISDNVLISKPIIENSFYFTYFTLSNFNFSSLNTGSTQPLITQGDLKSVEIIIPKNNKLEEFEKLSSALFYKVKTNNSQIQTLKKTRVTLLPKLMSGSLRVK